MTTDVCRADNDARRSGQRLNAAVADGREDFVEAEFVAEDRGMRMI